MATEQIKPFKLQEITAMKLQRLRELNEFEAEALKRGHNRIAEDARREIVTTRYEAMNPQSVLNAIQPMFGPRR